MQDGLKIEIDVGAENGGFRFEVKGKASILEILGVLEFAKQRVIEDARNYEQQPVEKEAPVEE